jgi:hypothetical protein
MNNPTLCEILIDGRRCNEPSSYVLKTAFATRLCCADCARRYKAEGVTAPIMEYALLELIPAREALEQQLKTLSQQLAAAYQKLGAADRTLDRMGWVICFGIIPLVISVNMIADRIVELLPQLLIRSLGGVLGWSLYWWFGPRERK